MKVHCVQPKLSGLERSWGGTPTVDRRKRQCAWQGLPPSLMQGGDTAPRGTRVRQTVPKTMGQHPSAYFGSSGILSPESRSVFSLVENPKNDASWRPESVQNNHKIRPHVKIQTNQQLSTRLRLPKEWRPMTAKQSFFWRKPSLDISFSSKKCPTKSKTRDIRTLQGPDTRILQPAPSPFSPCAKRTSPSTCRQGWKPVHIRAE